MTQEKNTLASASVFLMLSISASFLFHTNNLPKITDTIAQVAKGKMWLNSPYIKAKNMGINKTMLIYFKFEPMTPKTMSYLII